MDWRDDHNVRACPAWNDTDLAQLVEVLRIPGATFDAVMVLRLLSTIRDREDQRYRLTPPRDPLPTPELEQPTDPGPLPDYVKDAPF